MRKNNFTQLFMYKKIFIVAGHGKGNSGKYDPGAIAEDGTQEREITVKIAGYVMEFFENWHKGFSQGIGIKENLSLFEKSREVNDICMKEEFNFHNSLLVSIHCDWRGAKEGVGAYHYTGSEKSAKFADAVLKEMRADSGRDVLYNKPDSKSNGRSLWILQKTYPLAILIETGSLHMDSNEKDGLELLKSIQGQKDIAFSIFKGVLEFIGEKLSENSEKRKKESLEKSRRYLKKVKRGFDKMAKISESLITSKNTQDKIKNSSRMWEELEKMQGYLSKSNDILRDM